jgi:hypothetical protein
MKRFIFDLILFISVFVFPWWISLLGVIVGIFIFDDFYEYIVAGFIIFALYSVGGERFISSPIYFSLIIIISYAIIQFIKSYIILYKK